GEMCREENGVSPAMVNRKFANMFFAGSSPIGLHFSQPGNIYVGTSVVRGIVGDARESGLDREPPPTIYCSQYFLQPGTHFQAKVYGDPSALAETMRRSIHTIEPGRSVFDLLPLSDQISSAYAENRMRTILLAFFAASAILLACVGLYGTISYTVHVRR